MKRYLLMSSNPYAQSYFPSEVNIDASIILFTIIALPLLSLVACSGGLGHITLHNKCFLASLLGRVY